MSSECLVNLEQVTIAYDGRVVLEKVCLKVSAGETIGLWGPNGAGKTTLLKAVAGLVDISRGRRVLFGREFSWKTGNWLRRQIGYVPQLVEVEAQVPVLAGEVVMMGRWGRLGIFRSPGQEDFKAVRQAVKQLEIEDLLETPFGQLSGGQRTRVLLARALAQQARLLRLDEVFSWLDTEMKTRMFSFWKEVVQKKSLTAVVVSHEPELLRSLCTRLIRVEDGQLREGTEEKNAGTDRL
ncbi:MAG TPA: ATP-binding cassette domain-containing protein [bacterium]|nr:ATP-binding cassette domain-containing protein [bacterium]